MAGVGVGVDVDVVVVVVVVVIVVVIVGVVVRCAVRVWLSGCFGALEDERELGRG